MVVGVFCKRKFPKVEEKCRYGILVSAKDEENVIPRLINSIRNADYLQDKLDIIIIAHNCKDKTADVARFMGANVIVYNDENARTLGLAYQYALTQFNVKEYDGIIILNADNEVKKDFFERLNEAFVYHKKDSVVTSFRQASNIKDGIMPAVYGYYFAAGCSLSYIGREYFDTSCRVTGCGFVIGKGTFRKGGLSSSIGDDDGASVLSGAVGEGAAVEGSCALAGRIHAHGTAGSGGGGIGEGAVLKMGRRVLNQCNTAAFRG